MRTLHPIQAVIFDCDGTLVDSETLGGQAMWEVATSLGMVLDATTFITAYTGRNMATNIAYINAHSPNPMPEEFANVVRSRMAEKFKSELTEIAGAKDVLQQLQSRGIPVAVGTNGPRVKAELTLGLTHLLSFFQAPTDRLFCAYEHDTFKPDPELFLIAGKALGIAPAHCAVIEDSPTGLRAGVAAGMQVFSLMPPDQVPEDLRVYITHLPNLHALLQYL